MITRKFDFSGLTSGEVKKLQLKYGENKIISQREENFAKKMLHIICEPMFLLLIVVATIYFILGEPFDGAIMLVFVAVIISINIIQEWKADKILKALKDLSAPHRSYALIKLASPPNMAKSELMWQKCRKIIPHFKNKPAALSNYAPELSLFYLLW